MKSELSKLIDWGTYEHKDCQLLICRSFSSSPSISIFPEDGLSKESIWLAVVLFPLPVFPIKATFEPIGIVRFISFNAYFLL